MSEVEKALADMDQFVKYNFERLRVIVDAQWPLITSYSIESASKVYDAGWVVGFKRCMAELERKVK